ncbi:putative ribonucleoside-diphosphate reductase beta subunit [Babesia divergens]|uniref:Ribonucleoside-diphosphate reductase beta subunit n=1 Tax=Babesia divergens TaxID=32595 RepID=A0AAD9LL72_BABDI|nr:putative ribonucleoside-diphosphate reductase beta subunit [Babesia divergens]
MDLNSVQYLTPQEIGCDQMNESLLKENANRWVMFPIEYDVFWELYKEIENNFWAAEDFRFSDDRDAVSQIHQDLQKCIVKLLMYHSSLDRSEAARPAVLTLDMLSEVQVPEMRAFYGFQVSYENIHSEVFGLMSLLFPTSGDKTTGKEKMEWLSSKFTHAECFYLKVVLQCISKHVFRCSFGIIRAYLEKESLLPTFVAAMKMVEKDIGIHLKFASSVLHHLNLRLSRDVLLSVLEEALKLEVEFCKAVLPLGLLGISEDQLNDYVKSSVNQCLLIAGQADAYRVNADLAWMGKPVVEVKLAATKVKQSNPLPPQLTESAISFDEDF